MFTSGTTGKGVVIVTYVMTTPRMSAGTCCRKSYGLDHTECWSSQSFVGNCCGRNHNCDHLEQAPLVFLLYGRNHKLVFSTTPSSLHISFILAQIACFSTRFLHFCKIHQERGLGMKMNKKSAWFEISYVLH